MKSREDVIKCIECNLNFVQRSDCECCGYKCDKEMFLSVPINLLADALALLKAQEPRVITLEEVHMHEVYWIEQSDVARPWPTAMHHIRNAGLLDGPTYQDYFGKNLNTKEYGKTWRCWTSRPDEATREATPWN